MPSRAGTRAWRPRRRLSNPTGLPHARRAGPRRGAVRAGVRGPTQRAERADRATLWRLAVTAAVEETIFFGINANGGAVRGSRTDPAPEQLTNAMALGGYGSLRSRTVEETIFFGINANTLEILDVRAWDMWEHVCRTQGTSPLALRTAAEARDFVPESKTLSRLCAPSVGLSASSRLRHGSPSRSQSRLLPSSR